MAIKKKAKKVKQPLWLRILKIILITIGCGILIAGTIGQIMHYYRHATQ